MFGDFWNNFQKKKLNKFFTILPLGNIIKHKMEDDTEIKQKYLCQEIIEKNYNPDEFLEYIQALKGEDASLDSFSLSALKTV